MRANRVWVLPVLLWVSLLVLLACGPGTSASPQPSAPSSKPTQSAVPSTKPAATAATSPAPSVSFAGKTVTVVVSTAAGGGSDIIARLYAQYLGQHLPGKPTMVVRNMPGAGSVLGTNYVYSAKGDGLTIASLSASSNMAQLLGVGSVKYDLVKMKAVVGTASSSVVYASSKVIDRPESLMNAKGIIAGFAQSSSQGMLFILAKELMGFPIDKIVMAYSGSADARRALIAGETNCGADTTSSYRTAILPLVEKGDLKPLWQTGFFDGKGDMVGDPNLPSGILTVQELHEKMLGKSPSGLVWDSMKSLVAVSRGYDKIIWLPPNAPDNIVEAYRKAATNMVADAGFQKASAPLNGEKAPWWLGESLQKSFTRDFKLEPQTLSFMQDILEKKYGLNLQNVE